MAVELREAKLLDKSEEPSGGTEFWDDDPEAVDVTNTDETGAPFVFADVVAKLDDDRDDDVVTGKCALELSAVACVVFISVDATFVLFMLKLLLGNRVVIAALATDDNNGDSLDEDVNRKLFKLFELEPDEDE
jgi:hypothetical protein